MLHKQTWFLIAGSMFLLGIVGLVVWGTPGEPNDAAVSGAGLSETEIIRLAHKALAIEYSGTPEEVTVSRSTVGALNKFHCSQIGAMVSLIVSPLQGKPDICAADSTLWVVTLRGTFQRSGYTTDTVQVILDRTGRMMAVDSGELVQSAW